MHFALVVLFFQRKVGHNVVFFLCDLSSARAMQLNGQRFSRRGRRERRACARGLGGWGTRGYGPAIGQNRAVSREFCSALSAPARTLGKGAATGQAFAALSFLNPVHPVHHKHLSDSIFLTFLPFFPSSAAISMFASVAAGHYCH